MGSGLLLQTFVKHYNTELHLQMSKGSLVLTASRGAVDFSGLKGIWEGP